MNKLNQIGRFNQILIVLLLIQVALAAFILRPQAAASESGPLLPDFEASEVTTLTVAEDENTTVTLAKKGEAWVLPDAGDYPAKGEDIAALLDKVEAIKANRLVAQTQESFKRLQVADDSFNRRLDLTLADGTTQRLFVGSTSGANATHVRAGDQSEVYLADNISPWEINAQIPTWINPVYFTVPQDEVTALTLENANGTFQFTREGETWTMADLAADETFSENNFSTLLSQSTSVQMTKPIGTEAQAAFGFDSPLATVTLKTEAESYILQIGAKDPEDSNSYFFKASNSPYYVKIAAFTGNNFVDKTHENFLLPPPTPEAEGATPEAGGEDTGESQ